MVIKWEIINYSYFIDTTFLFTFLGVFIGFALTLYTYITSTFENIKRTINRKYKDKEEIRNTKLQLLPVLHTEIKDNILFLIYSLIVVVLLAITETYTSTLSLFGSCCTTQHIKNSILFSIFMLSVYALKDLVSTSFAISDFIVKDD